MTLATRPESATRSPWRGLAAAALIWAALFASYGPFAGWVVDTVPGLDPNSRLAEVIHFFVFDTIKIALLLVAVIFAVSVLRTFVSLEQTRALLGGRGRVVGYALAALLGVVMPFCSCSAVPMFIGFVSAGVPLGMTMTFLVASPLVNEVAVILVAGSFGVGVAAMYVATGLTVAVTAGVIIGRLGLERWVEPFVFSVHGNGAALHDVRPTWQERFATARGEVRSIVGKVWPFLLVGIAIGAAIHGWAPEDLFVRWAGPGNPLAVPVAVLLGIPLYSNAAGTIPLVEALHAKGVALGTAVAFMMSVVALSVPELVLLRRVLKPRLLVVFVGVVAAGILAAGYLLNAVI
ncbi:MAG TPA: hypothetical protein DCY40_00800 [Actinobacteria bacterium]|nr:hypothetical protein [Actinomycetota bacterium]